MYWFLNIISSFVDEDGDEGRWDECTIKNIESYNALFNALPSNKVLNIECLVGNERKSVLIRCVVQVV